MILRPFPTVSTETMICAEPGVYVAEASDLRLRPGFELGRVYDDACDVGLTVVGHRTGQETVFALVDTDVDREGDTRFWTFEAVTPGPNRGRRLTVFND